MVFLQNSVFSVFGVPETVHSDNGSQYILKDYAGMCEAYGITQTFSGSYETQNNASERRI